MRVKMQLVKYKVEKFRSIGNSGWISVEDVIALIGENESGKTNLLIPLWKLNPAVSSTGNKLDLLVDYPRSQYHLIENADKASELRTHRFIVAEFVLDEEDIKEFQKLLGVNIPITKIHLSRDYNDELHVELFNNDENIIEWQNVHIRKELDNIIGDIEDEELRIKLKRLTGENDYKGIMTLIDNTKGLEEEQQGLLKRIRGLVEAQISFDLVISKKQPIVDLIPKFIYYSSYENLDSDIYLPDAMNPSSNLINNKKNRTLNTLFNYVGQSAKQIYDLGLNPSGYSSSQLSEQQKEQVQANTKKRQVLLESAATRFTEDFNKWWKQEDKYIFKFEVDSNCFRIKVADSRRPAFLEFSSRSSGLQWFFSFFLIFLVESEGKHKNTILLLDEPGVTLHPNAQKQLYLFFDNLSKSNQIIYTTHSPFMINANQLDKVYAVYANDEGLSCVSADLRAPQKNKKLANSIYPAHAALGLSVSDTLLLGCQPVIVEGISDQIYFTLLKNALIRKGKLNTQKEIVFIPSEGVKGIKAILQILSGLQTEEYPLVIVDGDSAGKTLMSSLTEKNGLYSGKGDRIICLKEMREDAETEDLIPFDLMKGIVNNYLPKAADSDDTFSDIADGHKLICDQIKSYTQTNSIKLPHGFKVEIAELIKRRVTNKNIDIIDSMNESQQKMVYRIFNSIVGRTD